MLIHDFSARLATGEERRFADYRDKVLLIVNVASKCGFTPQYSGLQTLYKQLHPRGFEILAFPCDQFGHQEPGSDAEIANFCDNAYDFSAVCQDRGQRQERPPTLRLAQKAEGRVARRQYKMELHEVLGW